MQFQKLNMLNLKSEYGRPIPLWLPNRLLSARLEPVLSSTENHGLHCITEYFPLLLKKNN